jgi:6-phosphofructokinase 1
LNWDAVSGILQQGGTILGSSNKANPFNHAVQKNGKTVYEDYSDTTIQNARDLGVEAIVCIGGDGTMTIAKELMNKGLPVVGVPKTIDNDLYGTDITFGYDTAVSIAAEAIDRIHTTASSHHRVMLVEIMGRYAGWLTLGAGLAGGADVILIPELEYDINIIAERVWERSRKGRRFSIVAVAEGAKPQGGELTVQRIIKDSPDQLRLGGISMKLCAEIEDVTGLESRATILGHLQRGGTPTAFDRILATRYGVAAAELIRREQYGKMVALQGNEITSVAVEEVGGKTRKVDINHSLITAAKETGVSLGI